MRACNLKITSLRRVMLRTASTLAIGTGINAAEIHFGLYFSLFSWPGFGL